MPRSRHNWPSKGRLRGFSLVEALVTLAVIALVMGVMLPTLRSARASAAGAACKANLRSAFLLCSAYAMEHDGEGPAIGQPYGAIPNWALVVQQHAGFEGDTPGELYSDVSVLICPAADHHYPMDMVRTYAMNGTGHAGASMGDETDYDSTDPALYAAIRFDRIKTPSTVALLVDAAVADFASNPAPPNRCASVIDFRQSAHVETRLGRWHAAGEEFGFNAAMFDGSVRRFAEVPEDWQDPLP
jgi:competence protein ComGC